MNTMTDEAGAWEERYRQPGYHGGGDPASFLVGVVERLPRGLAVDLAMGEGRNALFLAVRGWRVIGIDRSRAALEKTAALALARHVQVFDPKSPVNDFTEGPAGLVAVHADLESYDLPANRFDVVLCFNYLQRSLFKSIERSLRAGGMLMYETYTVEQLRFPEGPHNPDYLLRPGELREAFAGLEVLIYRETSEEKGRASLLARKRRSGESWTSSSELDEDARSH